MPDINLNGNSDGVRMTFPRAASLAVVLLIAGGMWARVEFRLDNFERAQEERDKRMDKLTNAVEDLARANYRMADPPPRVDSQGRILK